ncbi:RcnB family protein [Brevundimonas sp.]|uniref:RcnB family protein n=1 Tax=Brevundimonas sp. TaxID=1871086 RepID=UPI00391A6771
MTNKALTAAIAAVMAATTLGAASAAEAQSRPDRGDRYEQRQDRGDRYDRRDDRRPDARQNQRNAQQQRAAQERQRQIAQQQRQIQQQQQRLQQQQRAQANRMMAQRRYNAGAYHRPAGYSYRQWNAGYTLPPSYRQSRYVVDHRQYGLRAPPRGYQYTRVDNDVVLTAVATGLITAVIVGLFN